MLHLYAKEVYMKIKYNTRWAGLSGVIASIFLILSVLVNFLMIVPHVNFYGGESVETILSGLNAAGSGLQLYGFTGLLGTLLIVPMILGLGALEETQGTQMSSGIVAMFLGVSFLFVAYGISFVLGQAIAPALTQENSQDSFIPVYLFLAGFKDLGFAFGSGLTLGTAPLLISLALRMVKGMSKGLVYLGVIAGIFSHSWYLFFFVPIQFLLFGILGAYLIIIWFLWISIVLLRQPSRES